MKHLFCSLIPLIIMFGCASLEENKSSSQAPLNEPLSDSIQTKSWLSFEYDSVNLYLYRLNSAAESKAGPITIVYNNTLHPAIYEKAILNKNHIRTLKHIMDLKQPEIGAADCFEPHHGIVFYKNDSIVEALSICTICNNIKGMNGEYIYLDVRNFSRLFKQMDFPFFDDIDSLNHYLSNEKK